MASQFSGVAIQENSPWITTFASQTRDDGGSCTMGVFISDGYSHSYLI
jgi:hypothetical protein